MKNNPALQFAKLAFHRYARVTVFAVLGIVIGVVLMGSFVEYRHTHESQEQAQKITATTTSAFARSTPHTYAYQKSL